MKEVKILTLREEIETSKFPPDIDNQCRKDCISNYVEATSPSSMETFECGICGENVKKDEFEKLEIQQIPGKELISVQQSDRDNLEE